jgi:Flp pilus assembly protein TadD
MKRRVVRRQAAMIVAAGAAVLVAVGCRAMPAVDLPADVHPQQRQRQEQLVAEFEAHRDWAQCEAARARLQHSDLQGCRTLLEALLARNPNHRDGRLLMADVELFARRLPEAIEHARHATTLDPADAEAHHALALLLEASGDSAQAAIYHQQAARLAPHHELYQAAAAALPAAAEAGPVAR